jgi:RNA polymerase sigma-70 factor (ECF subfamily)
LRDTGTAADRGAAARRLHLVADGAYPDWEAVYTDNVRRIYRLMHAKVANRPDAVAMINFGGDAVAAAHRDPGRGRSYLTATARTAGRALAPPVRPGDHQHRRAEVEAAAVAAARS